MNSREQDEAAEEKEPEAGVLDDVLADAPVVHRPNDRDEPQ